MKRGEAERQRASEVSVCLDVAIYCSKDQLKVTQIHFLKRPSAGIYLFRARSERETKIEKTLLSPLDILPVNLQLNFIIKVAVPVVDTQFTGPPPPPPPPQPPPPASLKPETVQFTPFYFKTPV
jgi:hypothetical protein